VARRNDLNSECIVTHIIAVWAGYRVCDNHQSKRDDMTCKEPGIRVHKIIAK